MSDQNKRKSVPMTGDRDNKREGKKSKGVIGGKWQMPHQKLKTATSFGSAKINPGDKGIWATCARGMEGKAVQELKDFFEECAENFHGITPNSGETEDQNQVDIETSIQMEMASIKSNTSAKLFQPVHLDLRCVLFFKTDSAIDPVDFVDRICKWIVRNPDKKKTRYINRLTPMTLLGKATEKGLEELTYQVLSRYFKMNTNSPGESGSLQKEEANKNEEALSYSIRPTIRNHNTLKRDILIKQIAASISETHPVNLTNPDLVIIVEVYQAICGMSVVSGKDWEKLKRYNIAELYPKIQETGTDE